MSDDKIRHTPHIEWDLHELGPKPAQPVESALLSSKLSPREFARAIAMGVAPANAPRLPQDEAA